MKRIVLAVVGTALAASAAQAQLSITSALPGTFIDISASGTALPDGDDTSASFVATHGNFILPVGTMFASSNGMVTSAAFSAFTNTALPFAGAPFGFAPLWDDFRTDLTGGDVRFQNNADRTIVQWTNVITFDTPQGNPGTWQLQIFDTGSPILAQILYQDVDFTDGANTTHTNGGSATIGCETSTGVVVQWSFNTVSISNGMVLSFIPAPGAAALLGLGGLVAARRRRS